jgi:hypothetical protein
VTGEADGAPPSLVLRPSMDGEPVSQVLGSASRLKTSPLAAAEQVVLQWWQHRPLRCAQPLQLDATLERRDVICAKWRAALADAGRDVHLPALSASSRAVLPSWPRTSRNSAAGSEPSTSTSAKLRWHSRVATRSAVWPVVGRRRVGVGVEEQPCTRSSFELGHHNVEELPEPRRGAFLHDQQELRRQATIVRGLMPFRAVRAQRQGSPHASVCHHRVHRQACIRMVQRQTIYAEAKDAW